MNMLVTMAVMAAMLTGPFPESAVTSRDLATPIQDARPRVAQNEREMQPAPLLSTQEPAQRIAAFWIILPN